MKILLVGAAGTIGRAIDAELASRHEIIRVGRTGGDHQADITDPESLRALFGRIGTVDAIVCAAGEAHFALLKQQTAETLRRGLDSKLMGQVTLTLLGLQHLTERGSVTLTGGILSDRPFRSDAGGTMANAAVEGFVRAAAIELPPVRINAVSPTLLAESVDRYGAAFRGFEPAPAARVALGYSRSVEGAETGQIIRVH